MKNKEFFDIVRDIISGALPLWELPRLGKLTQRAGDMGQAGGFYGTQTDMALYAMPDHPRGW